MNIKWDSSNYTNNFDFVHKYGEDVLSLINLPAQSFVVDLGCGNGALSQKLLEKGYKVLGIDSSSDMIDTAKSLHSDIEFLLADATKFELSKKADGIFSNAVIHWIDANKQDSLIKNISNQIKLGGQFVCEFGGSGNGELIHSTLEKNFAKRGLAYPRTFYFPTIGEYAPILEKHGFKVELATLFDRPTEQKSENGVIDWINMFVKKPFENVADDIKEEIINETQEQLKPHLFVNGKWFVDYVRIRFKAIKIK